MTRTGYHGTRVNGQEPGRYEAAGMVVSSWLQGTSRDGDPQDHVHNQIARMSLTDSDGKWRVLDTMGVRTQLGAVRAIVTAHVESGLSRSFGVDWVARPDGQGREIDGITQAQIDAYSTRTQQIKDKTPELAAQWERTYGRAPNRRELQYIQQEATMASRESKEDGAIDWDKLAEKWEAKWDALDGTRLAAVAPKVSNLRGPDGGAAAQEDGPEPDGPEPEGPAPRDPEVPRQEQVRVMQQALARVQDKHSTWTRADLMREMADCLPSAAHHLEPAAAVALLGDLTDQALAGEAGQVLCLDAPEWPPLPDYLRREVDGRSVYTRPGTERYATQVQLSREEQLLAAAAKEGAPRLDAETSAKLLGATPEALDATGRARAQEATAQLPSGVRAGQAAALHAALTSGRTEYTIVGPAGSGKTHTLAQAAQMWRDAGMGPVIGLAPSQAARNVLAEAARIPACNTAQFLGHTKDARGKLGAMKIRPGTLILLDEGSMTSLQDLRDILALAAAARAKVIVSGDHGQLTAVEGGGGMVLLTRTFEYAQLPEPVRFANEWEREASLRLRAGDAAVLTEYDRHGRIRGGPGEEALEEARKAYLAGYLAGRDVLLMAQSNETCRELSQRIRDDLQHLGLVGRGAEASLRDGGRASIGDLIITRENDPALGVANGDTWRVEAVDGEAITMRKLIDADRETGERRFAADTVVYGAGRTSADLAYAVDQHGEEPSADLAYAITGHSAQGRTVSEGIAVITGTETREWAYVAMSRGINRNSAYVATGPARVADPAAGTRPAPEVERRERIERERAGLAGEESGPAAAADAEREPIAVLSDVLENEGTEYSALEVQRRNLAEADNLAKLHAVWQGETREAVTGRYERLLRENLSDQHRDEQLTGSATWLWRTLRGAEAAGLDAGDVLARAISARPLTDARDVAAVVDSRIREAHGDLIPQRPGPWAERVPGIEDPDRREYVQALAGAMDERTERLGEFTAQAPPAWEARALGPVPEEPLERLEWEKRAADVAAYREMFGYDHPTEPIGPEPVNSPEARAAWHAAFTALGPDSDLAKESDGRLLNLRASYEAETAWAPRYVGDELRQVRRGADDAGRDAILAEAEAAAARERGDEETAARQESRESSLRAMEGIYRSLESKFAATMDARAEWERNTERSRHQALAAHAEYMRRHPDAKLEPLRSAEPPRPSEEERAELERSTRNDPAGQRETGRGDGAGAGEQPERERKPEREERAEAGPEHEEPKPERERQAEPDTPGWVTELAERNRAAMAKIEEYRGLRVPSEDHEWEDQGEAWPQAGRLERDAVLQLPKPEIQPAPEVTERAAQMAGADREAGE